MAGFLRVIVGLLLVGVLEFSPAAWATTEVLVKCYQPQIESRNYDSIEAGDYYVVVFKDDQGRVKLKEGLAWRPDRLRSPLTTLLVEEAGETYFLDTPDHFFSGGNRIELKWSYGNRQSYINMSDFEHGFGSPPFGKPICFAWGPSI